MSDVTRSPPPLDVTAAGRGERPGPRRRVAPARRGGRSEGVIRLSVVRGQSSFAHRVHGHFAANETAGARVTVQVGPAGVLEAPVKDGHVACTSRALSARRREWARRPAIRISP